LKRTALIAGATGLVGQELLELLLNDPFFERVVALSRKPLPYRSDKLVQCIIEFDNINSSPELVRGSHVFCCLGTTIKKAGTRENFRKVDLTYTVGIAKEALLGGAIQLNVISALGADKNSFFFYNRVKGEMEEAVKALGYHSLNIFRPSLLLGNRQEFRGGERISAALIQPVSFLLRGKLRKYAPVKASAVARAMLEISKQEAPGIHLFESDLISQLGK
jgi:uncharacterized protein YbjT (DUF2867 family)